MTNNFYWVTAGHAQQTPSNSTYPSKPIKIIVPYASGSQTDSNARLFAPKLAQLLGGNVIIENKAGASGIIGSEYVSKSAPDGYSLITGTVTSHGTLVSLVKNLPYNVDRDFTAIGMIAAPPAFLAVHPSVPASNLKEFIDWAKNQPLGVSYSSAGSGSSGHLTAELLALKTGAKLVQVPYTNAGQAITDLLAGHVKMMIYYSPLLQHIRNGKLRGLAVFAEERASFAKDIPTAKEQGFPGMASYGWSGLFGPAGLPVVIRDKLSLALKEALSDPLIKQQFFDLGQETILMTPQEFSKFISSEIVKWSEVVKISGAKMD